MSTDADTSMVTLFVFAVCAGFGGEVNRLLGSVGLVLPGFVTAMLAGVLLTNMGAVTSRCGPSLRAMLVLPMVGAGILDLANAFIIEGYLRLLL